MQLGMHRIGLRPNELEIPPGIWRRGSLLEAFRDIDRATTLVNHGWCVPPILVLRLVHNEQRTLFAVSGTRWVRAATQTDVRVCAYVIDLPAFEVIDGVVMSRIKHADGEPDLAVPVEDVGVELNAIFAGVLRPNVLGKLADLFGDPEVQRIAHADAVGVRTDSAEVDDT